MGVDELKTEALELSVWQRHRFLVMIAVVVLIALVWVVVALNLYNSSGAAPLDLSRPGYQSVRDQASREDTSASYPSSGTLDKEALDQFEALYATRSAKVTSVNSFDPAALSDESLLLFAPNSSSKD